MKPRKANQKHGRDDAGGGEGRNSKSSGSPSITVQLSSPSTSSQVNTCGDKRNGLVIEATSILKDVRKLNQELVEVKLAKAIQDEELAATQDCAHQQKIRADELMEQFEGMQNLMQRNLSVEEMEKMLEKEEKARIVVEQNLKKVTVSLNDARLSATAPTKKKKRIEEKDKIDALVEKQTELKAEVHRRDIAIQNLTSCLHEKQMNISASSAQAAMSLSVETTTNTRNQSPAPPVAAEDNNVKPNIPSTSSIPDNQNIPREEHAEDIERRSDVFYCNCTRKYKTLAGLRNHIRSFTAEPKFKCATCMQRFLHHCMLKRHQRATHHAPVEEGYVGCSVCGNQFPTYESLYAHRKTAHPRGSNSASVDVGASSLTQESSYDVWDDDEIMILEEISVESRKRKEAQVVKVDVEDDFEVDVEGEVEDDSEEDIEDDVEVDVEGDAEEDFEVDVEGDFEVDVEGDVDVDFEGDVDVDFEGGVKEDVKEDVKQEFKEDVKEEFKEEFKEDVNEDVKEEFKEDVNEDVKEDVEEDFEEDVEEDVEEDFEEDVEEDFEEDVEEDYEEDVKEDFEEDVEEDFEEDVEEDFEEDVEEQKPACGVVHGSKLVGRKKGSSILKRNGVTRPKAKGRFSRGKVQARASNQHKARIARSRGPGKVFACDHCESWFPTLTQLRKHKGSVHGLFNKRFEIGCNNCGLIFATRSEHAQHRIKEHRSTFGRKRRANPDPPMPKLTREEPGWIEELVSPQPIPIPILISNEDETAVPMDDEDDEATYY